jgi:hypothetical protein
MEVEEGLTTIEFSFQSQFPAHILSWHLLELWLRREKKTAIVICSLSKQKTFRNLFKYFQNYYSKFFNQDFEEIS